MPSTSHHTFPLAILLAFLTSCGGGPPSDAVEAEITRAVLRANTAMFDGNGGAEVVAIRVDGWEESTTPQGLTGYRATWNARLRFTEPLACILAEMDGTRVVQVVAEADDELAFTGRCSASDDDGGWHVFANVDSGGAGPLGAGAWQPIAARATHLTMGYPVFVNGMRGTPKFRRCNFEPLNRLRPYVVHGSPEHQELEARARARFEEAQAAAAEQARQREEARAAERAAQAAERQRQREEAEARALAAREAAARQAEAERHARLLTVLQPLRSPAGAILTAEAGAELGTLLFDVAIDEAALTASGRAVDLREMPFEELTFEASVDERGGCHYRTSRGGDPIAYRLSGEKLVARGSTVTALDREQRDALGGLVDLGQRLAAGTPAILEVETLDADAAAAREPELQMTGLSGAVCHRGRLAPKVANLFAADLGATRAHSWRNQEVVAIRLHEPVRGSALYLRGTKSPSTECVVTVNGVHRATIAAIPRLGAALVTLPAGLEVLDLRLEAKGTVSLLTIGLVR